ncbi:hypothetical protein [Kitasatospora sp. NPDC047058]|uniref:hypothetical protein n=1 Tax=Kitasatospora sp. NPDC047058 TaxID=3155620 RepID=UPI0033EAAA98
MKHRVRGWTAVVAVTTAAAVFGLSAYAAADTTSPPLPVGADTPPPAVEDFAYPGAETISKVKLIRGDGHILLADCAKPSQIQVWTRAPGNPDNKVCFTATTTTGQLTLELPDVFAVQTADRALHASVTASGATQALDVDKNGFQPVGEGLGQAATTLVDLRVTG